MPNECGTPLPGDTGVLAAELRERLFRAPAGRRLIGAEVEVLPLHRDTRQPLPLSAHHGASSLGLVREAGARHAWNEHVSSKGTPCFALPDGGAITFEPGGQIEYSSPPCVSVNELLRCLRTTNVALCDAADAHGAELAALGIHPDTGASEVPMQLRAPRYERMAAYFEAIGPHGARMMRQTASFQVSVDLDADAELRWRVLNAAAPHLTAIFANSPRYGGQDSGYQSVRANSWRRLDPSRTGIFDGGDPACTYLGFALSAPMMMLGSPDKGYPTLRDVLRTGRATREDFETHLSTLFPDVRPRGYLEVRAIDAIPAPLYAAPLAMVAGITYDRAALFDAIDLLGDADDALLVRAGTAGLRDPVLAREASALAEIALGGCESLGDDFFGGEELERARDYFAAYTSRGRSLADEVSATTPRSAPAA